MLPNQRDPRTPIKVDEHATIPKVWLTVLGLVGVGAVLHIILIFILGTGLVIWPFIFSIAVLLMLNDAADQSGGGMPAIQVYGMFFATLVGTSLFVFLVSAAIPWWFVLLLIIGATVYVIRDWKERKEKDRELERRRLAGLCVKCCTPVTSGLEDLCPNCFHPVNAERLDLFRLGRAISNKAQSNPSNARQVLTGTKPTRGDAHLANLQNQRAARYKKK